MSRDELLPDEAERLVARLRRLAGRKGWSESRLCRELPLARDTWRKLVRQGFMTRRTAERICAGRGWDPRNVLASTAARRPPLNALFLPPALQEAARYCEAGMTSFRAQLLHAAAANLLILLERAGVRALMISAETLGLGLIRVLTHHPHGGLPCAEVRFLILRRRLVYELVTFTPSALTEGHGEADDLGFGFCLEFLTESLRRDKLDVPGRLNRKIRQQLAPYGHPA